MYSLKKIKPILTHDLIRLGRNLDGGYVLNRRTIEATQILLSFGIHMDWSFERNFFLLNKKKDFRILAFDFSVGFGVYLKHTIFYLWKCVKLNKPVFNLLNAGHLALIALRFLLFFKLHGSRIKFYKIGLDRSNHGAFVNFNSIMALLKRRSSQNGIMVKLDIEGFEYDVLTDVLQHHSAINTIILEFHDLASRGKIFEDLVDQLAAKGYCIVHVHPNNCCGYIPGTHLPAFLEITFTKSIFFTQEELSQRNDQYYPVPQLDYPNLPTNGELKMNFECFG